MLETAQNLHDQVRAGFGSGALERCAIAKRLHRRIQPDSSFILVFKDGLGLLEQFIEAFFVHAREYQDSYPREIGHVALSLKPCSRVFQGVYFVQDAFLETQKNTSWTVLLVERHVFQPCASDASCRGKLFPNEL